LLHRAQPLMHLLKSVADQFKRFAQPFLQCALQFLVNRRAHLVDLLRVVFLQLLQPKIDNRTDAFERLGQLFALILRRCACFFAIARKFIAQPAIDRVQSFHQFRFHVSAASTPCHQNDDCNDKSAADQPDHEIKQRTHSA
jgi:hypothetical protein